MTYHEYFQRHAAEPFTGDSLLTVWNGALEEAAKLADAEVKLAQDMKLMCQNDPGVWRYSDARERNAADLARAIRAMQTTAGAAGGEGK